MYVSKKDKMIWLTLNQEDVVCLLPPEMDDNLTFGGRGILISDLKLLNYIIGRIIAQLAD